MTLRLRNSSDCEDAAEDALGEQVLDEHLLDGIFGEVGIDGLAAERVEGVKALAEGAVALLFGLDEMLRSVGQLGDALLKLADGGFPFVVIGLAVGEELVEQGRRDSWGR